MSVITAPGQAGHSQKTVGFVIRSLATKVIHFFTEMLHLSHKEKEKSEMTRTDVALLVAKAHKCSCRGTCQSCTRLVDDVWSTTGS